MLRDFFRSLFRPSVDDCLGHLSALQARLEKAALRHLDASQARYDQAAELRDVAEQLEEDGNDQERHYLRALRVQSKLHDLVA